MAIMKRMASNIMKVAKSPITKKVVHGARVAADIGSIVGVPASGALAKGLSTAEKVIDKLQE